MVPALRFNNSLERLIELTGSFILMVTVYYRERLQIKISQGKGKHKAEPRKVANTELPVVLSQWNQDSIVR